MALSVLRDRDQPHVSPEYKNERLRHVFNNMVVASWEQGLNIHAIKTAAVLYDEVMNGPPMSGLNPAGQEDIIIRFLRFLELERVWIGVNPLRF